MTGPPTVSFVVRYVNQYREPFYRDLKTALHERGVEFELIHGDPSPAEVGKRDSVSPDWATFVPNRVVAVGSREFVHQPVLRLISKNDLVIVEQASRLLLNYRLLARRLVRREPAIALIGHGTNLASGPSRIGEIAKRWLTGRIDWFFAYTDGTRRLLEATGFDPNHITVFNNTLDMTGLQAELASITSDEVDEFRQRLGIGQAPMVLVLGSLYADKRPDLAIAVAEELESRNHDAHTVIVGSGALSETVKDHAADQTHIHHIDAVFGREKALALRAADILLIPGVSGLVILDGFAAGIPIVTALNPHHPPEIDYVTHDENGLIVDQLDASMLASAVSRLLDDPELRQRLGRAGFDTGADLTIDAMVQRFADGVVRALSATS